MSMFDNIFINTNKLPVSDEEKTIIGDNTEWQTKDFDSVLTEIYITDDDELKINRWEYETVPIEERPYPDGEGFLGMFGCLRRVNERLETIPYHGIITFYGRPDKEKKEWYEFYAKFTDGKLVSIDGGKEKNL